MRVVGLKVDYVDQPMGLENTKPRLSWRLESSERNVRQSAYRILVASTEAALRAGHGDLWDSGKVTSAKCIGIQYRGQQLTSRMRCCCCVQVWDERDAAYPPSATSWWEMGLLESKDWIGQWLAVEDAVTRGDRKRGLSWIWGANSDQSGVRRFRFKFTLPVASQGGELFAVGKEPLLDKVTGLWMDDAGITEPHSANLSGRRFLIQPLLAGDHVLAAEVDASDCPAAVVEARSAHGFALFLRVRLENGESLILGTGPKWSTSLAHEGGWRTRGYDDGDWDTVRVLEVGTRFQSWPAMPAMYLRRRFTFDRPLLAARLYVTALGVYEARINGRRVGDALLTPEISQYAKRVLYQVYDVSSLTHTGNNVLALIVADGWYGSFDGRFAWGPPPRRVLAQLELLFADGTKEIVATGPGWRIAESPIRESEIRVGEVYDARLDKPGWDSETFDDAYWPDAEVAEAPPCRLVAQVSPPIRAVQTLQPRAIEQVRRGVYVIDFGQNFSGWCRVQVTGTEGARVELRYAELLSPSGEIDQSSMGVDWGMKEDKRDVFILKGGAPENLEPHFTYRGFRYVQITGLPTPPTPKTIEGVVIHTDLDITGRVTSASSLIEEIWRSTLWTQRSNFVAIPTDCPHREQRGWMADAGIFWDTAAFNMDVNAFTSRQLDNVVDDQAADGALPMATPEPRDAILYWVNGSAPGWGDGAVVLLWTSWQRYGDLAMVERNWDAMDRYLNFIQDSNPDYVWRERRGYDYGDWLAVEQTSFVHPYSPPTTPKDLIGTAYWAYSLTLLGEMAEAIGRSQDADRLRELFGRVRKAFNKHFVTSDGIVGNGSQTSYVLALKFGLLPDSIKQVAAERLAADIRNRGGSLTTGFLGTQFILDVLLDSGFSELAYTLLLRTEYPSWGYMVRNGATTIWENWSGEALFEGDVVIKASRNHCPLGAVCGFLYRRMAGIDAAKPGFEIVTIRPAVDERVKRGCAEYDSILGKISTDWTLSSGGLFTLDVVIPANATARIHLPAQVNDRIEEGGAEISRVDGIQILSREENEAVVGVGSGSYHFAVRGIQE